MGVGTAFSTYIVETTRSLCQKEEEEEGEEGEEEDPYLTSYGKMNLKMDFKNPHIRFKTIKLLKENTGSNLCELMLGNNSLVMTLKTQ